MPLSAPASSVTPWKPAVAGAPAATISRPSCSSLLVATTEPPRPPSPTWKRAVPSKRKASAPAPGASFRCRLRASAGSMARGTPTRSASARTKSP
ncbi:hypothetical protein D9M72_243100 [compost metagenome]